MNKKEDRNIRIDKITPWRTALPFVWSVEYDLQYILFISFDMQYNMISMTLGILSIANL